MGHRGAREPDKAHAARLRGAQSILRRMSSVVPSPQDRLVDFVLTALAITECRIHFPALCFISFSFLFPCVLFFSSSPFRPFIHAMSWPSGWSISRQKGRRSSVQATTSLACQRAQIGKEALVLAAYCVCQQAQPLAWLWDLVDDVPDKADVIFGSHETFPCRFPSLFFILCSFSSFFISFVLRFFFFFLALFVLLWGSFCRSVFLLRPSSGIEQPSQTMSFVYT